MKKKKHKKIKDLEKILERKGLSHAKIERMEEKISPGIHKKILKKIKKKKDPKKPTKARAKVRFVMEEFKAGKLRSGSKHGPEVTNPKQAIAIALSEARKVGKIKKPRRKKH